MFPMERDASLFETMAMAPQQSMLSTI